MEQKNQVNGLMENELNGYKKTKNKKLIHYKIDFSLFNLKLLVIIINIL